MSKLRLFLPRTLSIPRFRRIRLQILKQTPPTAFIKPRGYDAVVLSGGGIKGIAMLGAMHTAMNKGLLKHVHTYIGSSIGAVVATVMVMGKNPKDVFNKHVLTFRYSPDIDITRLEFNFGLDSGRNLDRWLERIVPPTLTFARLQKRTGKNLVVCATNLNSHGPEYFSNETTPDLEICKALRMSCSVPLYFSAVKHGGSLYVDGGVANNFPVEYAYELGAKKVLGIRFRLPSKTPDHPWTLDAFLGAVLESTVNRPCPTPATILSLETGPVTQPLNFKLSQEEMTDLYMSGYWQSHFFFKKIQ